jgi:hypothetical protein
MRTDHRVTLRDRSLRRETRGNHGTDQPGNTAGNTGETKSVHYTLHDRRS